MFISGPLDVLHQILAPYRPMSDIARRTGPAVEAHFQFLIWLVPTIEKFPRSQKFLLGDRIQTTALTAIFESHVVCPPERERRGRPTVPAPVEQFCPSPILPEPAAFRGCLAHKRDDQLVLGRFGDLAEHVERRISLAALDTGQPGGKRTGQRCSPLELELTLARAPADEHEAQELEGFRFSEPSPCAPVRRMAAKLDQAGLVRMQ
jgi:hypothetical protein